MTTANTTARPAKPLHRGPRRNEPRLRRREIYLPKGEQQSCLWGGSSYFSIPELYASATAQREDIDNRPPECAYHLLHVLVEQLLNPIREAWGEPIVVSSGYRCKELNALVGGAKNSHHLLGCAADIIAGDKADHRRLFNLIRQMQREGKIRFTQLILEDDGRWIHISYVPSDLRCQVIGENKT